jgi:hypothetical protein
LKIAHLPCCSNIASALLSNSSSAPSNDIPFISSPENVFVHDGELVP